MNFPHKSLESKAFDKSDDASVQFTDYPALLAQVIARQTSSQSAQDYAAAKQGLRGGKASVRSSFMDDRMVFFAGRPRSGLTDSREEILFRTGCFRPDLAQQDMNKMHD